MGDRISMNDGIMRGFTYEDAAMMLRNTNPDRGDVWEEMKKDLRKWVRDNINDMMYELDQHKEEVWAAAYPDEVKPLRNHPNWSSERLEALAQEIYQWLLEHEMWIDICIYYDGKRMSTGHRDADGKWSFRYNGEPFYDEADPRDYFEYVNEPHILSMSFEGAFYEVMNGYSRGCGALLDEFETLLAKHGLRHELGDAWNLTCYER